jgi:hypothetical protein
VILEEEFANAAIGKSADGHGIFQCRNLKLKRLGEAAIRQSLAPLGPFEYVGHGSCLFLCKLN